MPSNHFCRSSAPGLDHRRRRLVQSLLPYSLPCTLDYCFGRMADGELDGPLLTRSALQNAMSPIQNMIGWAEGKPSFLRQVHQADLAVIMPAATALIGDQNIRFVFVDLPVPHPPGIYDRRTGTLSGGGTTTTIWRSAIGLWVS